MPDYTRAQCCMVSVSVCSLPFRTGRSFCLRVAACMSKRGRQCFVLGCIFLMACTIFLLFRRLLFWYAPSMLQNGKSMLFNLVSHGEHRGLEIINETSIQWQWKQGSYRLEISKGQVRPLKRLTSEFEVKEPLQSTVSWKVQYSMRYMS